MKIFSTPGHSDPVKKKKKQVVDSLRQSIQANLLLPNEALPSTRELARQFSVHRHTVMTALDELVDEGWLRSEPRSGFKVNRILPTEFFKSNSASQKSNKIHSAHEWDLARNPESPWAASSLEKNVSYRFQSGLADLRLFPIQEFRKIMNESLVKASINDLSFADPAGHEPLRNSLKEFLRRTRHIQDREIFVTHGSQEAIFLTAQLLLKPGDRVVVESLGYPPAWDAFKMAGAKLLGAKVDHEGMVAEDLHQLLKKNEVKLIYLTPLHQYPTTVTLSPRRRGEIYQLARKFGVPILEDDYDHEFHYQGKPLAPMVSSDPDERVIYVSTFTKVLFPSVRLGYMAVPKKLLSPLTNLKRSISRQTGFVLQDAVATWIQSGGTEKHLYKMRQVYHKRRDVLVEALNSERRSGLEIDFEEPRGGMALWLKSGVDGNLLQKNLQKYRVYAASGEFYRLKSGPSEFLRLGFANQNESEIKEATRLLCAAIRETRTSSPSGRRK